VRCSRSDPEGRFLLRVDEPGKYQLLPSKESEGYLSQRLPFYRSPHDFIQEVTIGNGSGDVFVPVRMGSKNGVLTGKVTDTKTNLPVETTEFFLCHAMTKQNCFSTAARSAEGKFKVFAPHVPFTLRIRAQGYEDWFGFSGVEEKEPIYIASGTTLELAVHLRRRRETINKALSDAEKQTGLYLPAPIQLAPDDNIKFDSYPRVTKLEWEPVAGAVSYIVEVDYCQPGEKDRTECVNPLPHSGGDNPPMTRITNTNYTFNFIGAQPGKWRVRAVDKDGGEGFNSPWRKFIYTR
jgi:hypothetical protein